jgi:hypothetical protein
MPITNSYIRALIANLVGLCCHGVVDVLRVWRAMEQIPSRRIGGWSRCWIDCDVVGWDIHTDERQGVAVVDSRPCKFRLLASDFIHDAVVDSPCGGPYGCEAMTRPNKSPLQPTRGSALDSSRSRELLYVAAPA